MGNWEIDANEQRKAGLEAAFGSFIKAYAASLSERCEKREQELLTEMAANKEIANQLGLFYAILEHNSRKPHFFLPESVNPLPAVLGKAFFAWRKMFGEDYPHEVVSDSCFKITAEIYLWRQGNEEEGYSYLYAKTPMPGRETA